jgi:hypothetical protein
MLRRRLSGVLPAITLAAVALASPALALDVGQKAPDFVLNAPGGKQVKLADLLGPLHVHRGVQQPLNQGDHRAGRPAR